MAVYEAQIDSAAGEPALVLAADTIVVSHTGVVIEKPKNAQHHLEILKGLRDGLPHKVRMEIPFADPVSQIHYEHII